jgi:benzoyl-CoA reductase/2-hydroxyglutaryl-CoA dehydratase subunit BcrC/BadD/HgdB
MMPLESLVEAALRDPLGVARAYCQAGGRVVGYVGSDIPVELIAASHAFPLRLPSFAQRGSAQADRYLESSFGPEARSIAEQYLQGEFDFLDALVLPRSNDGAQRLYYYLSELRTRGIVKGPVPLIFDLAKIPRAISRGHSRAVAERFATEIGVDLDALGGAIQQRNRRRMLVAAAASARVGESGLPGSVMERIFRAADCCHADAFDAAFEDWLSRAETPPAGPRLMLVGSVPPDERLHRAVETAGGNIVAESSEHFSGSVVLPAVAADASIGALADHYQSLLSGPRAFVDRAATTRSQAESAAADGVIIWLVEQEEALVWDLPAQCAALGAAGIATLTLTRRCWDCSDGALGEIAAFTHNLKGAA